MGFRIHRGFLDRLKKKMPGGDSRDKTKRKGFLIKTLKKTQERKPKGKKKRRRRRWL